MKKLEPGTPEYAAKEEAFDDNLKKMRKITKEEIQPRREGVQFMQELGGLAGRILLAIGLVTIASKRLLLWLFQVPGLVIIPLVWFWVYPNASDYFAWGAFLAGACIVAQFSYFGEYLPKAFPVHLRGTGGAFATNVGGRMIGTSAAFLTTNVIAPRLTVGSNPFENGGIRSRRDRIARFHPGFCRQLFPARTQNGSGKSLEKPTGGNPWVRTNHHAHRLHHRRRRGHVLRQLHARQHARDRPAAPRSRRAARSRPTRPSAPTNPTSARSASSSAASTSICSRNFASVPPHALAARPPARRPAVAALGLALRRPARGPRS